MPGQRSFDASRLFGRRRERGEPRRAVSEDQRGQSEDAGDLDGKFVLDFVARIVFPIRITYWFSSHVIEVLFNYHKDDSLSATLTVAPFRIKRFLLDKLTSNSKMFKKMPYILCNVIAPAGLLSMLIYFFKNMANFETFC